MRLTRYCGGGPKSTTTAQCARELFVLSMAAALALAGPAAQARRQPADRAFTLERDAEVVITITAECDGCDWGRARREAAVLTVSVDGAYSQHVMLARGRGPSTYRIMLGGLAAGAHRVNVVRDAARSAPESGRVTIDRIDVESFSRDAPEYAWLSRAPVLHARAGSVERFSDVPLLMYVEHAVTGEQGTAYDYQYTAIFSNEDGGTAADRLMATWGRTTDIEFVYGIARAADGASREEIQAEGHTWVPFGGPRLGTHPMVWVATDNNMVADRGPADAIRFAPAPELIALRDVSREAVMDAHPWTYAVASAEAQREGRIDAKAAAGSGRIPDPRRYATIEACGEVRDATLAFDVGARRGGSFQWFATDRGEPRFRIARGGCFRGGAPLPDGVSPADITALRARAYTRPPREGEGPLPAGSGRVVLTRVNRVFMLDREFLPSLSDVRWRGMLPVPTDGTPVVIVAPEGR